MRSHIIRSRSPAVVASVTRFASVIVYAVPLHVSVRLVCTEGERMNNLINPTGSNPVSDVCTLPSRNVPAGGSCTYRWEKRISE